MRNFKKKGIETNGRTSGKIKLVCPECRDNRHNKHDKSLSVNIDEGTFLCHHCGWKGYVPDETELREKAERKIRQQQKHPFPVHFQRPVFNASKLTISEKMEQYLTLERCIPQEVIRELRITEQQEYMPQSEETENCICFNYFEKGVLINTKFRSGKKHFKMVKGAELIPYHIDGILNTPECIITEGEFDAASMMAIGRNDVISIPAGANSNFNWLDRFVETHFEDKKLIYIAVDTDQAGIKLREELVRRLGAERCRIMTYGPECKDANEHLVRYGAESLRIALEQSEEIPLEGVFTAGDLHDDLRALYENGVGPGADTGWENFDKYCTLELQRLLIVSGKPGDGKSEWVDELVLRLCLRHEWKTAYFSPENMPITYHLRKLMEKLTGLSFNTTSGMTEELYQKAENFFTENYCHILPGNDNYSLENILSRARQLVARRGIRILVIDPLNRIDQHLEPGQTELEYLSSLLNQLSRFAIQNRCLVILVAHPRKMNRNPSTGLTATVNMYDIYGSADFYNKADFGIIVERDDAKGIVTVHVEKVKFKHLGFPGEATFVYNLLNGRYSPCETSIVHSSQGDHEGATGTLFDNARWI